MPLWNQKTSQDSYIVEFSLLRVIEDLVDLLIEKQLFTFTDLPKAVQQKLGTRKKLRKEVQVLDNLIDNDEKIF